MSDEQQRLTRIESKLDKLSETVVQLARMEERMVTLFKRMDSYDTRQGRLEEKVDDLEEVSQGRGHFIRVFERIFWIVVTAAIGTAFYVFK
tara:strand:+ start:2160 stop:2432 length:273 start_codon:yes stop_codon:yes gene_type:complete